MLQPPKTKNDDRKWIKNNSPKRNAGKRYKLPGLSQFAKNFKFFLGLNQNLKIFRPKTVIYPAC